jgi:hypothetical protein
MIRPWLIALSLFGLSGCGGVVPVMLRTTASTAALVSGGYRALRVYDAEKQGKIVSRAKSGDPSGAAAELTEYIPKRDTTLKALDAASVAVESAYALIPAVGQATDPKRRAELGTWITTLMRLGVDVASALSALGIRIPNLGGGQ